MSAVNTGSGVKRGKGVEEVSYEDLYARWERGNWCATELDFSVDREHWRERLTEQQRQAALWNYVLFFHGEDAVANSLSPYIDAAPTAVQKYFLATQQVDEARHAVFFKRFLDEVVLGGSDRTVEQLVSDTRQHLTWGYRKIFRRLDQMAADLRRDPSRPRLAAAVCLYHLMIEGTLAQPSQHCIQSYLEEYEILPGFTEGMRQVSIDEQRHIGFGVTLLAELVEDPACRDAVEDILREITPYAVSVALPPNLDSETYMESLGFTMHQLYTEAQTSLFHKLRMIGMPYESLNGAMPFPPGASPDETARRTIKLVEGSLLGSKHGPVAKDPESVELLFDTIKHAVDHRHAPRRRTTIQWHFDDVEPWHLVIDNGSTEVSQGTAGAPDLTLRCRFEEWVDVIAKRSDPRVAMLKRRIRPSGSFRTLLQLQKTFGG